MKRFQFHLEPVLNYKQQTLDALMVELGAAQAKVREQEDVCSAIARRIREYSEEYEREKLEGLTILEAMKYQGCLEAMERDARREAEKLTDLRAKAEQKRLEVVAARQDTFSLEKLRDMRRAEYDAALAKQEEKALDDLTIARKYAQASA